MHTPEDVLLSRLSAGVNYDTRTVYIIGDVDHELARKAIVALEVMDATPGDIRVILSSYGGEEFAGYAIHDAILMCKNTVIVDGYGAVMSIAAAVFMAGDVRRLAPNCELMVHNGTIDSEANVEQDSVIELAEQIKKDCKKYYAILSYGSKQPISLIKDWCRDSTHFTAKEAVAIGFADSILKPTKKKGKKK